MDVLLREAGRPVLRGARVPNHDAYRRVRQNLIELFGTWPDGLDPQVPACPEWTVRDLVAHLLGVAATAVGRLSGWPATHPSSSADMDIAELLEAWERVGAEADVLLAEAGGRSGSILVMDAFTHELDLRYAIGAGLPEEHPAFAGAFEVLANGFAAVVTAHHLPALRLSTGITEWTAGSGEPVATLTAHPYDLYRSLAGRRTHDQVTALNWDRDSHRWLPALTWGPFSPPEAPVEPQVDCPDAPSSAGRGGAFGPLAERLRLARER